MNAIWGFEKVYLTTVSCRITCGIIAKGEGEMVNRNTWEETI